MSSISPNLVAVQTALGYGVAPYGPTVVYPEFQRGWSPAALTPQTSPVYAAVRALLAELGLDRPHLGTPEWNPFRRLIQPGGRALVKPNWVLDAHPDGEDLDGLITHSSLLRPVLDYLALAMEGRGTILIADAPLPACRFQKLLAKTGVEEIIEACGRSLNGRNELNFQVGDLRKPTETGNEKPRAPGRIWTGDPLGYQAVDLGRQSLHAGCAGRFARYQGLQNGRAQLARHHDAKRHEYLISRSALSADFVINLPKLKTDQKTGITFALKNLLGIQGSPDWLPHFSEGTPADGGDAGPCLKFNKNGEPEFGRTPIPSSPRSVRARNLKSDRPGAGPAGHGFEAGCWYANDTLWRTVLDINRIFLESVMNPETGIRRAQRYLILGDAVLAGEGEGPFRPTPHKVGLLFAGINPAAVDRLAAGSLGFDPQHIPLIRNAGLITRLAWPEHHDHIEIMASRNLHQQLLGQLFPTLKSPAGWIGHLEKTWASVSG